MDIQKNFDTKWSFLSCCGATDAKHVAVQRPSGSFSEFYNYILQRRHTCGIIDADCKFTYIDVETNNGRANDESVFRLSLLHKS